jgi:hypothetical protein
VKEEPFRRVLFERDKTDRRITRFQLVRAGSASTWFRKVKTAT